MSTPSSSSNSDTAGSSATEEVAELLASAGVELNGSQPWDPRVHHPGFVERVLRDGSLGLGESYMDGWWDCDSLDQFFDRILRAHLQDAVKWNSTLVWTMIKARLFNQQTAARAFEVGERHYDIGNDLYRVMLDRRMVYSCGYWREASTLDEAQEHKLDLICRKIGLKPGQTVLDIGCGWGSFALYAAQHYGAHVLGITVSREQQAYAADLCKGYPVEIRLQDYRDLRESFNHIVSVGMFEHVGYKNYGTYMDIAHRCLKEGGLFLLHCIGTNTPGKSPDPWMERYIFPNSMLPSLSQITEASEGQFVLEDLHNFGADYDKTLMAWHENFEGAWGVLRDEYGERFYRMWEYYLLSCAGLFRSRSAQLWQIVFSKNGVPGGYQSVR